MEDAQAANALKIDRRCANKDDTPILSLFVDASSKAIGAVIYVVLPGSTEKPR
jgi:hypothetical protein